MVGNEIEQQLDVSLVQAFDQPIEVVETAKHRINGAVVRDVIAEIQHGRGEKRRQPHRVDAEPFQVVEPGSYAFQVSLAVAACVLERDRRYLVNDRAAPPLPLPLPRHSSILRTRQLSQKGCVTRLQSYATDLLRFRGCGAIQ